MRCPTCKKSVQTETPREKWFPFCCERCQLADLGKWLDEDYRVSEPAGTADMAAPSPPSNE